MSLISNNVFIINMTNDCTVSSFCDPTNWTAEIASGWIVTRICNSFGFHKKLFQCVLFEKVALEASRIYCKFAAATEWAEPRFPPQQPQPVVSTKIMPCMQE